MTAPANRRDGSDAYRPGQRGYRPERRPGMPASLEKARDPRKTILRLLEYLKPFSPAIALSLIFVVLYTLLGLAGPYLTRIAFDRYIANKDIAGLGWIALLMLGLYLANNFFQGVSSWIMARISQRALKRIRTDLFRHLQSLSVGFFDTNQPGELMSRLTNDIDAINQAVSQNVVSLIASVLSMVGILVAMFIMNFWLALASLVVVPIIYWFTDFVARYTRKGFRDLQKSLGGLNATMEESISGLKVVRAFRRSASTIATFRECNQAVYKSAVYANSFAMLMMPITNVLGNFFVIVLVGLGGFLALRGLATVGTIAAFISYGQGFINPVRQLSNIYNAIQGALAGAERIFDILDTPPEMPDQPVQRVLERIEGCVRFERVRFGYDPERPVLKDMTLEAGAGQTVALVGPTGAGKTTVINLLTRFYEIQSGRITIDGRDIREIPKQELRRRLGLVLQDTFLFSGSVMENIRFGRLDASDEECIEAARLADADHFIRQLPQGYQTQLSERASNLSQGQRQLLAITRAILSDPAILILDEATSSVDTRTEAHIQKALLRLMRGRTSFVIAHRLSTIRDADNVVVINNGEIVEQGRHHELLEQRGFYHHLYLSQFKGQSI